MAKIKVIRDWVLVGDLGIPDTTPEGLVLPDMPGAAGRYMGMEIRFGQVVSTGPGRIVYRKKTTEFTNRSGKKTRAVENVGGGKFIPYNGPKVGEIVIYKRSSGLKMSVKVDTDFGECWSRTLDQDMLFGVVEDFKPWWDVESAQKDPGLEFSG